MLTRARGALAIALVVAGGCSGEPIEAGGCEALLDSQVTLVEIIEGDLGKSTRLEAPLPSLDDLRQGVAEQAEGQGLDADTVLLALESSQRASQVVAAATDAAALLPSGWLVGSSSAEDRGATYLNAVLEQAQLVDPDAVHSPRLVYCSPASGEVIVAVTQATSGAPLFGYLR